MPTPPGDAYASKPGAESLSLDDLGDQAPAMYSSQVSQIAASLFQFGEIVEFLDFASFCAWPLKRIGIRHAI